MARNTCLPFRSPAAPAGCTAGTSSTPRHAWRRTAGLLRGRRATSHWPALDHLKHHGAEPTGERVVTDGKYVTAAGVSSGIDMGLTLLGRLDAGSPGKAPAHLVEEFRSRGRFVLEWARSR